MTLKLLDYLGDVNKNYQRFMQNLGKAGSCNSDHVTFDRYITYLADPLGKYIRPNNEYMNITAVTGCEYQ